MGPGFALAAVWVLGLAMTGCGDDNPLERASGAPMQPPALETTSPRPAPGLNTPPTIESVRLNPQEPGVGDTLYAVVKATDPDRDALTIRFEWEIAGRRATSRVEKVSLGWARKGDPIRVRVIASDGDADSEIVEAEVRVHNRPPRIRGGRLMPEADSAAADELFVIPDVEDPDGDAITLTYEWNVNDAIVSRSQRFPTEGLRRGDRISVRIVASDGEDPSDAWVSREIVLGNRAPQFVSKPGQPDAEGVFRYKLAAKDPDGDRLLHFSLVISPPGMTLDPKRQEIVWSPTSAQSGIYRIEIAVVDRRGARSTQQFELEVGHDPGDDKAPPTVPAAQGQ